MSGGARAAALVLLALGLVTAGEPLLAQCAMCKATVVQSPEGRRVAESLNAAILLLLAAPYLVFGTVAAVLLRPRIAPLLGRVARLLFLPR